MRLFASIVFVIGLFHANSVVACIGSCGGFNYRPYVIGLAIFVGSGIFYYFRARGGAYGVAFEKSDEAMAAAVVEARRTLLEFWERFRAPQPGDTDFIVKFNLTPDLPDGEHIWAEDLVEHDGRLYGSLGNEPFDRRFRLGQRVEIDPALICDWCYFDDGVARGHFMTRVMLDMTSKSERRRQMRALGWA
jgi:uncharacterized protein YegJ (DUF2314 family)